MRKEFSREPIGRSSLRHLDPKRKHYPAHVQGVRLSPRAKQCDRTHWTFLLVLERICEKGLKTLFKKLVRVELEKPIGLEMTSANMLFIYKTTSEMQRHCSDHDFASPATGCPP